MRTFRPEPIELSEISSNLALVIPLESKDYLYLYNNRKDALRLFAFYKNSMTNDFYAYKYKFTYGISSILSSLIINHKDSYIYHINSNDISDFNKAYESRLSNIVFIWESRFPLKELDYENFFITYLKIENELIEVVQKMVSIQLDMYHFDNVRNDYELEQVLVESQNELKELKNQVEEIISIFSFKIDNYSVNREKLLDRKKASLRLLIFFYMVFTIVLLLFFTVSRIINLI